MKKIILLLLSIFYMQSCVDSNVEIPEGNFHSPSASDNKVLSKVSVLEVGNLSYDINYSWDSGKLMSVIASNGTLSYNLQYTGNQLTQVVQKLGQGAQLVTRTSELVYTDKKLTSITGTETSVASGTSQFVTSISYTGNNPSNITRTFTQNGSTTVSQNVNFLFANGNISDVNYFFGSVNSQSNLKLVLSNYDSKPNPLHTLPAAFTLSSSFLDEDPFSIFGSSVNNYKTSTKNFLGGSTQENTVYTYSEDGFPVKSVSSDFILDYQYIIL